MKTMKFIKVGVFFAFVAIVLSGCGKNPVDMIKDSYFTNYPQKTIGEAVDGFFGKPQWTSGKPVDAEYKGYTLVNCSGTVMFDGTILDAAIQFLLDEKTGEFELNALEIDGIPQNQFMQIGFLELMYE